MRELTPLVKYVGSDLGGMCFALALHNADSAVEPRELLRDRRECHCASELPSCTRGSACIAEFPDHRIPSVVVMIPCAVPVVMPLSRKRLHIVPILVPLTPWAFPKPVISPVKLNSASRPSDPIDFIAPPSGLNFSSNSFCPIAKIFTSLADSASSIYWLPSEQANRQIT